MKKLLVLLSSSVLLSLSFSSIYLLNYKNNNQVVLKQENKEEDLSVIFYNGFVSVISNGKPSKEIILNALKSKYKNVDFSKLDIEVGIKKYGMESNYISIKPKKESVSNKYKNQGEIVYYLKKNIHEELKLKNNGNIGTIQVNKKENILKEIVKILDTASFEEKKVQITDIKEGSAVIIINDDNDDFYGKTEIKFTAKKKTLSSVLFGFSLELSNKQDEEEIIKIIKEKYPKLKSENLKANLDFSKNSATIIVNGQGKNYEGLATIKIVLPKPSSPKPRVIKMPMDKMTPLEPSAPKTQPKENIIPELDSNSKTDSNSNELPKMDSKPEHKIRPEEPLDIVPKSIEEELLKDDHKNNNKTHSEPSPTLEPNKPTTPIIDKTQNKDSNNQIPSIPNNTVNKSNKKSTGSKTGVIVGSTLGVGSVVGIGAAGSWIYFKRRK
uniref:Uncharacterized protein n=1 Tax=Mycoplasma feriruminatoris TaxID=1179777 RepID=A0A654IN96_9MOLU|nr:hypothetical protein MF5582_00393 [Mycoplasma feriruminatoris]